MLHSDTKYIAVCLAGIDANCNDVLLNAFHSLAASYHFKLLIFNSFSTMYYYEKHDIGESNIFRLMNYDLIDGIIMLSETIKYDAVRTEIAQQALAHQIPVVTIDHEIEGCYHLGFRYSGAMEQIVEHLIQDHHYQRINFIAGQKGNPFSEERLDAYKRVLERHNIPIEEERIGYGEFWGEPTCRVMDGFLASRLPFPEAIVCANDTMAIAVYRYLAEKGYDMPEAVAVTGFDGIPEALAHQPRLTTAKHDYYETAWRALDLLKQHFAGEKVPAQTWVESVFLRGETCGCRSERKNRYSMLVRDLYDKLDDYDRFSRDQIAMAADLTDNDSFQGVFDNLMKYSENFCADTFWLCIVDDFLLQKENLSDIIEETNQIKSSYSSTMDIMLSMFDGQWAGISDFPTKQLLPKLPEIFEKKDSIMFVPLHVLDRTVGYMALAYDPKKMHMSYTYQMCMSISNALETTKTHQRQKAMIDSLENKYVHDPMTGLFNRRGFYQRVEAVYQGCRDEGKLLLVVSADLNGLKTINDTYGHADGDIAISTVGKALAACAGSNMTCARFGGDEFVAAGQIAQEAQAEAFYEGIRAYLEEFNAQSEKPYQISASVGIVTGIPMDGVTLEDFIKAADEKMYEEKARYHRNEVVYGGN